MAIRYLVLYIIQIKNTKLLRHNTGIKSKY